MPGLASAARWLLVGYLPAHALATGWWALGTAVFLTDLWWQAPLRLPPRFAAAFAWTSLAAAVGWIGLQLYHVVAKFEPGVRATGLAYHPNALGTTMVATTLLLAVIADRLPAARYVAVVATPIALALVVASGSRSVLLGMVAGLIGCGFLYARSTASRRLAVPLIAALAVSVVALLLSGQLVRSFERLPLYSAGLDLVTTSPWIGTGEGSWHRNIAAVEPSFPDGHAPHEHSLPLRVLIEGGAIAFVLLGVLMLERLGSVFGTKHWQVWWAHCLVVVATSGLLIQSLVDLTLTLPSAYIPLLLAGTILWKGRPTRAAA